MASYLLRIDTSNEAAWKKFKKKYKEKELGTNLDQAIFSVINKFLEEEE